MNGFIPQARFQRLAQSVIELLYPDHEKPDANNYGSDGKQFRAPDYSLHGGRLLIELKSMNPTKLLSTRIEEISNTQGKKTIVLGRTSLRAVFENLPNPEAAHEKIAGQLNNALTKCIVDARRQFEEYLAFSGIQNASCVAIVTDNSTDGKICTDRFEFEICRLMGADGKAKRTGPVSAVIYMRSPEGVMISGRSSWLKIIYKEVLNRDFEFQSFLNAFIVHVSTATFKRKSEIVQPTVLAVP